MDHKALEVIKQIKEKYRQEGVEIVGIFGSVARGEDDKYSDIDIAFKLNYEIFFNKYKDGFSQILKIDAIRKELEKKLKSKVDLISMTAGNDLLKREIEKDLVYV